MNDLIVKNFENTEIEIIMENNEPLFEVYSTGMALGQVKTNSVGKQYPRKERIEENLKSAEITPCVRNGHNYINESQLYDLMLEMKTDKVKPFRKWVTGEVLPTIRKTGGYVNNDDQFIQIYLPFADENTKQLFRLQLSTIRQQNELLESQKPLVEFAETVTKSCDNIKMRDMAKLMCEQGINIGEKRLYRILREHGILMRDNIPYQTYVDRKYFFVKESSYTTPYGTIKLNTTTLVTPTGQIWLVGKVKEWLNEKEMEKNTYES